MAIEDSIARTAGSRPMPNTPFLTSISALWRRRRVIAAGVLGGAAIGLVVSLAMPRRYTATATLFVVTPTYVSALRPAPLTPDGYRRLTEADYVIQLVNRELVKRSGTADGVSFQSRLYSTGESERPYLPLLGLSATADSAERAQSAAALWAQFAARLQSGLDRDRTAPGVELVLANLSDLEKTVSEAEREARLATAARQLELARLDETLGIPLMARQLRLLEWTITDHTAELKRATDRANATAERLKSYVTGFAAPPPSPAAASVLDFVKQIVNDDRAHLVDLQTTIASLERELADQQRQLARLRSDLLSATERRDAQDQRRKDVEMLNERASTLRSAYTRVTAQIPDAKFAAAHDGEILRTAEAPSVPTRPSSPNVQFNIVLGAVLGLCLACAYAWITAID